MRHVTVSVTRCVTGNVTVFVTVTVTRLFVGTTLALVLNRIMRLIAPAGVSPNKMRQHSCAHRRPFRFTAGNFTEDAIVERKETIAEPELVKQIAVCPHLS